MEDEPSLPQDTAFQDRLFARIELEQPMRDPRVTREAYESRRAENATVQEALAELANTPYPPLIPLPTEPTDS